MRQHALHFLNWLILKLSKPHRMNTETQEQLANEALHNATSYNRVCRWMEYPETIAPAVTCVPLN